jgi:hypothetical protein
MLKLRRPYVLAFLLLLSPFLGIFLGQAFAGRYAGRIAFHANVLPTQSFGLYSVNGASGYTASEFPSGQKFRFYGPNGFAVQKGVTAVKLSEFDSAGNKVAVPLPLTDGTVEPGQNIVVSVECGAGYAVHMEGTYHEYTVTVKSGSRTVTSTHAGVQDEHIFALNVNGQTISPAAR